MLLGKMPQPKWPNNGEMPLGEMPQLKWSNNGEIMPLGEMQKSQPKEGSM
jgi:hypothetical protein